jgi:hypothetical protein
VRPCVAGGVYVQAAAGSDTEPGRSRRCRRRNARSRADLALAAAAADPPLAPGWRPVCVCARDS